MPRGDQASGTSSAQRRAQHNERGTDFNPHGALVDSCQPAITGISGQSCRKILADVRPRTATYGHVWSRVAGHLMRRSWKCPVCRTLGRVAAKTSDSSRSVARENRNPDRRGVPVVEVSGANLCGSTRSRRYLAGKGLRHPPVRWQPIRQQSRKGRTTNMATRRKTQTIRRGGAVIRVTTTTTTRPGQVIVKRTIR